MLKSVVGCAFVGVVSFAAVSGAAGDSLLSNNIEPGEYNAAFPEGTQVQSTQMTASWVTDGEFATDEETIETSRRGDADQWVVFDGNTGANWKSRTYSKWGKGKWVTLTVDLGKPYVVNKVDVWAIHEATRNTGSVEVLLSEDGEEFVSHASGTSEGVEFAKKLISPINVAFDVPGTTRYIQIRMKAGQGAKQQQIGEIAIWGDVAE